MADSGYSWKILNHLQIGRYAEYYVKMEFALHGFQVYTSQLDARGIDFVVRCDDGGYYEIQVKSLRGYGYIFIPKHKCRLVEERLIAVVLFHECKAPSLYLVPTLCSSDPDSLFVSRDYEEKKSKPEWGLRVSAKNQRLIDRFQFSEAMATI